MPSRKWRRHGGDASKARRQFVFGGQYIDEPVCKIEDPGGTPQKLFYLQDVNYNVAALAHTSGTMQERYNYEPYGTTTFTDANATPRSATLYDNTLTFQGRRYDAESDLYYYRNRWYSPRLGRFLQRDPAGYQDGMNLYEVVGGGISTGNDPFGLFTVGEECHYTGKFKVERRIQVEKRYKDFAELILGPAKVRFLILTCKCELKCCDYDFGLLWRPVYIRTPAGLVQIGSVPAGLGWSRDPKDDFVKWKEIDRWRGCDSYAQMMAYTKWGTQGIGGQWLKSLQDRKLRNEMTDEAYQVGGELMGEPAGEAVVREVASREEWQAAPRLRIARFRSECRNSCEAKKGESE